MNGCAYCGRNIGGLELAARTRTARYHEDCRLRELGLPPEPWMLVRIILFIWEDAIPFIWGMVQLILNKEPSEHTRGLSPREETDEMAMKHGDPWL